MTSSGTSLKGDNPRQGIPNSKFLDPGLKGGGLSNPRQGMPNSKFLDPENVVLKPRFAPKARTPVGFPGTMQKGGGLTTGGALQTGGSLASGGTLGTGGDLAEPRQANMSSGRPLTVNNKQLLESRKNLYHNVLNLTGPEWEGVRENASQISGMKESPFWGKMNVGRPKVPNQFYFSVMNSQTPQSAARKLEAPGHLNETGGGFAAALKHSLVSAAKNVEKIHRSVSSSMPNSRSINMGLRHIPTLLPLSL